MVSSLVAYYRVSTRRQGQSGLGLESQQQTVRDHATRTGQPIAVEYTEIESGRKCDRPQLAAAVAYARLTRSTLVVAKLDRLARDARFLLSIVDAGVTVYFCDLPSLATGDPITGRLILTVMAAMAEFEVRRIGQRIVDALAAKRARGEQIDYSRSAKNLTAEDRAAGCAAAAIARRARTAAFRAAMRPIVQQIRDEAGSLRATAQMLNERGFRTQQRRLWTYATVQQILLAN